MKPASLETAKSPAWARQDLNGDRLAEPNEQESIKILRRDPQITASHTQEIGKQISRPVNQGKQQEIEPVKNQFGQE
jgi:hypothetical protein